MIINNDHDYYYDYTFSYYRICAAPCVCFTVICVPATRVERRGYAIGQPRGCR